MTISEATAMIRFSVPAGSDPGKWADLGCGSGTFTSALADILPPGSMITAVDRDPAALKRLPLHRNGVGISSVAADFTHYVKQLQDLNGVLMANALHFIAGQEAFLQSLRKTLRPGGLLILVEYDITKGSPWVPYPVPAAKAGALLSSGGFSGFTPLQRRASRFGSQFLYSAVCHT